MSSVLIMCLFYCNCQVYVSLFGELYALEANVKILMPLKCWERREK